MAIIEWLNNNIVWGIPMLLLMMGTGLFLGIKTGFVTFRRFGTVMKYTTGTIFKRKKVSDEGAISPFQAVSTALAATVGTGNIVGVAVAIQLGGPGAIFWMWLSSAFGMVTKYCEVMLSVAYRERNVKGELVGGPMYYMEKGIGKKWMSTLFCTFAAIASFGIGSMVQANSLAGGLTSAFNFNPMVIGIVVAILAGMVLIGGIKRISSVAEILVPFMAAFYIIGAIVVLIINAPAIPAAFGLIFKDAFTGHAATGGFAGATVMYGARIGVARGVFTNEAGLGSAPIAHASADNDHPARQGLWGSFEVFLDTIVMCTVTALVVLTSGLWTADPMMEGTALSNTAFGNAFFGGQYIVSVGLVLFAFATIIAWYYYGEKCVEYLFGQKAINPYRVLYIITVYIGCVANLEVVWELADFFNGLMAIPNLTALLILAPVVKRISDDFWADPHRIRDKNEDFSHLLTLKGKSNAHR